MKKTSKRYEEVSEKSEQRNQFAEIKEKISKEFRKSKELKKSKNLSERLSVQSLDSLTAKSKEEAKERFR